MNDKLEELNRSWVAPKPELLWFDPKKPKPEAFAAYTRIQMQQAYAAGLRDAAQLGDDMKKS